MREKTILFALLLLVLGAEDGWAQRSPSHGEVREVQAATGTLIIETEGATSIPVTGSSGEVTKERGQVTIARIRVNEVKPKSNQVRVEVVGGESRPSLMGRSVSFETLKPILAVERQPSDATVQINGSEIGRGRHLLSEPGEYRVRVSHPEYVSKDTTLRLESGDQERISVRLNRKEKSAVATSSENSAGVEGSSDAEGRSPYLPYLYGILVILAIFVIGLSYFAFSRETGQRVVADGRSDKNRSDKNTRWTDEKDQIGQDTDTGISEDMDADLGGEGLALDEITGLRGDNEQDSEGRESEERNSEESERQDSESGKEEFTRRPGQSTRILPVGSFGGPGPDKASPDQYDWGERIGAGGMSTVWLAQDHAGRDVALKMMDESMLGDEELVRKFLQEGKALNRINSTHPDAPVVNIHSYGYFESDRPYLALEYLEGTSLTRAIEPNSPMQAGQALPVIKQIAIALSAAHANGIYHRDVKPSNVVVVGRSSSLKIKLIDFGVARHEYVSYVTMDGTLMGTPPYISPEQGKGGDIDSKSDIYSLGVLAYALLGGSPPFTDQNPLNVLKMHQEAPVPPLPDQVPTPVAELIYWMLEKNPEDRPSKTWQVVGRIDELIADHG